MLKTALANDIFKSMDEIMQSEENKSLVATAKSLKVEDKGDVKEEVETSTSPAKKACDMLMELSDELEKLGLDKEAGKALKLLSKVLKKSKKKAKKSKVEKAEKDKADAADATCTCGMPGCPKCSK